MTKPTGAAAELLAEIEQFLIRHDVYASNFGRAATNESSLVLRLRRGCTITLATADKIRAYMAAQDAMRARPTGRAARRTRAETAAA